MACVAFVLSFLVFRFCSWFGIFWQDYSKEFCALYGLKQNPLTQNEIPIGLIYKFWCKSLQIKQYFARF